MTNVNPAAGTQFRNTLSYQWVLKVNDPTVPNPSTVIETIPEPARCDNQLTGKSPGCVFTTYGPVLTLPVSFYGAAAINVLAGMTKQQRFPRSDAVGVVKASQTDHETVGRRSFSALGEPTTSRRLRGSRPETTTTGMSLDMLCRPNDVLTEL